MHSIPQTKQLMTPHQSFQYNEAKIRHSTNTVKAKAFVPGLVLRLTEADAEASGLQGQFTGWLFQRETG